jgi:hypothetical protein
LKCHCIWPVDLFNPYLAQQNGVKGEEKAKRVFEPLSYKEMAMREDLHVDLWSGPAMKNVADSLARQGSNLCNNQACQMLKENNGPFTVDSDILRTVSYWRFHPSIIAILNALFNSNDEPNYENLVVQAQMALHNHFASDRLVQSSVALELEIKPSMLTHHIYLNI